MRLKAYSRNNPLKHLILHTSKRYLWLPFVIFAASMTVFVATEFIIDDSIGGMFSYIYDFHNSELWEVFPLFLIAISVFSAYTMFSFLFKQKTSSMMLLTGVSRAELFLSRYVFGLISVFVPAITSFFCLLVLGARNVEQSLIVNKNMLIICAMFAMIIIFAYTLSVIAISLCGRKLEFFAVCLVCFTCGLAVLLFIGLVSNAFVHGFAYPIRSEVVNIRFRDIFNDYSFVSSYGIFKDAFAEYASAGIDTTKEYTFSGVAVNVEASSLDVYLSRLLCFSAISVALIPLALWLFKRRNAEYDGKSNANKAVSVVCSVIPALALSALVFVADASVLAVIIALVVFTLLALLFYAFFNGTVRNLFKAVKFVLPITGAFAIFILVLHFDLTGYSKTVPSVDDVESVVVSYKGKNTASFGGSRSGTNCDIVSSLYRLEELPKLTTKEDIQTVIDIHGKIIADGSMTPSAEIMGNYSDTAVYVDYNIVYKLKNGREVVRSYSVMKLSTLYSTLAIENTIAYRECLEATLKSGNEKPYYDDNGNLITYYERISFYASNNMLSEEKMLDFTLEEKQALLDAIIADKLDESFEEAYHPKNDCLGVLWFSNPSTKGDASMGYPNYVAVYENDKNILGFLNSKGLSDIFNSAYEIKSIKLYSYNYYGKDRVKEMSIDRSYMAYVNKNLFELSPMYENPTDIVFDLGEVPKEDWEEVINKSYLSYFRDGGNKYAVITITNSNNEERVVTKFIPE